MASGERGPERFLPPDPRVAEPYRLTPQLAFRVAMIGFLALAVFAVLFLRLWALQILAGDKYLARANDNRVRKPPGRCAARLDRRPERACPRLERGRVAARALAGRPAEALAGRAEGAARARPDHRVPSRQILQKLKQHGVDPLTPVVVQSGLHEDQILYLEEHQASFPGVQLARSWLRLLPVPVARRAGARLRRPDLAGRVQAAERPGLLRRRLDRAGGRRVDLRQVPARPRRPGAADRRLAGPAEGLAAPGRATAAGRQPAADDRLPPAAGRREGAPRTASRLAHDANEPYADGAAIVAMDPNDGSVLAMASYPTYQPSVYVGRPT